MILAVAFGGMVLLRSAFQKQRKTDLDVFTRAAWAVRENQDIYATYSDRSWNYVYPSFFAIVMTPLAEPPTARTFELIADERDRIARSHGATPEEIRLDRARLASESQRLAGLGLLHDPISGRGGARYLPFWVSVSVWYLLSLAMIALSAHWIASAIQAADSTLRSLTISQRGWWMLRLWPVIFCAPPLFNGLSRGQSDALVLLSIAAFLRLASTNRAFASAIALAVAPAVKVIPGLLVLYPLWRRDTRSLAGLGVGAALTLLIIPAMVFGPSLALSYNLRWLQVMGLPGLGLAGDNADSSRKFELYGLSGSDSQNFLTVLHNIINITTTHGLRPAEPAPWLPPVVLLLSAGAVLATLWAMGWRRAAPGDTLLAPPREPDPLLVPSVGVLLCVMLMVSPVTHTHYFGFALPLIAWLVSLGVRKHPTQGLPGGAMLCGLAYLAIHAGIKLNGMTWAQDIGVLLWVGVGVWAFACIKLRQESDKLRYA